MAKLYNSDSAKGLASLIILGIAILATNCVFAADSEWQQWYEKRIAELAACKGNLACIDRVKKRQRREAQAAGDHLNTANNLAPHNAGGKNGALREKEPANARQTPAKHERASSRISPGQSSRRPALKTDEFDLGDLDF